MAVLEEVVRSGVRVDACPGCRGIYFDRGELETVARARGIAIGCSLRPGGDPSRCPNCGAALRPAAGFCDECGERVACRCPGCGATMRAITVSGTQVDACPGCWGIWLDGGELDALAAKGKLEREAAPEPRPSSGGVGDSDGPSEASWFALDAVASFIPDLFD